MMTAAVLPDDSCPGCQNPDSGQFIGTCVACCVRLVLSQPPGRRVSHEMACNKMLGDDAKREAFSRKLRDAGLRW